MNAPGRPAMFSVTNEFLKCMGINKVEDLPDYNTIKTEDEELTLFKNIETEGDELVIYGDSTDLYKIKDAIEEAKPGLEYTTEEITWLPDNDEYITLEGEDKEMFDRLLSLLDECDDVQDVYHNVEL